MGGRGAADAPLDPEGHAAELALSLGACDLAIADVAADLAA
jgi:hypothetical protein